MNKKLMLFLNACMLQFANVGGGYNYSAQILETDLSKLGIKIPKKLWFQYKLPGGISPEKFEIESGKIDFFAFKYPTIKDLIQVGCVDRGGLSDEELDIVEKYRASQRTKYLEVLDKHFKWVKENNPELSIVNVPDDKFDKSNFLRGALYGFGPEEISYFINRSYEQAESDHNEQKQLNIVLDKIGVRLEYILCPDNRALLQKQMNEYLMKKNQGKGKE